MVFVNCPLWLLYFSETYSSKTYVSVSVVEREPWINIVPSWMYLAKTVTAVALTCAVGIPGKSTVNLRFKGTVWPIYSC